MQLVPVIGASIKQLKPLTIPVLILLSGWFASRFASSIPASFAGVWFYGPYLSLAVAALLGMAYNRSRAVLATLLTVAAYYAFGDTAFIWNEASLTVTWCLVALIVPINLALVGWYKERGVFNWFGALRGGLIFVQFLGLFLAFKYDPESVAFGSDIVLKFTRFVDAEVNLAWLGYVVVSVCGLLVFAAAMVRQSHICVGLFVTYVGLVLVAINSDGPDVVHAVGISIGLLLSVSILRDSYNMAYRDDLTGLPQRRALNELLMSLGGDYAIAMMDVDHFKKFNDTHGHDVGDDVLKMVATQIGQVRDGGRAFRFGGEEFAVVYPGKVKEQTLRSLERVRTDIEGYQMVIRSPKRNPAREDEAASQKRGKKQTPSTGSGKVSVTISIGVADRASRTETTTEVLKKADEALYEAKAAGRNKVIASSSEN